MTINGERRIRIEPDKVQWPIRDNLVPAFATHFLVVTTGSEVTITFGHLNPAFPGLSNSEIDEKLETGEIAINPVSRVVMTKNGFNAFAKIINKHLVRGKNK